jgi:uncharacterized OB-fold protein
MCWTLRETKIPKGEQVKTADNIHELGDDADLGDLSERRCSVCGELVVIGDEVCSKCKQLRLFDDDDEAK